MTGGEERPSLREPLLVWTIFAVFVAATFATYSRIPAAELWNVSASGLGAGLSRALVYLNFPVAFAAIAIVLVVEERVRRPGVAAVAVALCAVTAVPGVVRPSDLDARWVNALPALGVAFALVLTGLALGRGGLGLRVPPIPLDVARLVVALVLGLVAAPWVAAALGFHVDGPYLSSKVVPESGHPHLAAVHLGLHHGLAGALLAVTALLLSRVVRQLVPGSRRTIVAVYLSVMLVWGLANTANDAWDEQVVKRGWAHAAMPSVLTPALNAAWAVVLAVAAPLAAVVLYRLGRDPGDPSPPARVSA